MNLKRIIKSFKNIVSASLLVSLVAFVFIGFSPKSAYASTNLDVTGSFAAVGQNVSFDVNVPQNGGAINGTFSGACNGTITGNYTTSDNSLSGSTNGSCSFLGISKLGSFNFQGTVDTANDSLTINSVTRSDGSTPGSLSFVSLPLTTSINVSQGNGNNNSSNTNSTQYNGNPIQNFSNIVNGQTYTMSQNPQVAIKFSSLPAGSNNINFRQFSVSSGSAYEITSNMTNGTFSYDLTLPLPAGTNNFIVKYAETTGDLASAQSITQGITNNGDGTLTIHGLNHFTIFVVDTNPSSVACIGAGSNCYSTIQAAVNASSSGDTINVQAGNYNETVNVTKSLTFNGTGSPTVTGFILWASSVTINNINSGSIVNAIPSTSLTNPVNSSNKTNVSITGTGLANANVSYSISDGVHPPVTGTGVVSAGGSINISGINVSSLNDGVINLSVTLNDGSGHSSSASTSTSFKDTIAPATPSVGITNPINLANQTSVTLNGTGEAGATVNYSISDGVHPSLTGTGSVNGSGNYSFSSINVSSLNDGTLNITVTLTDSAGNTSNSGVTTTLKDTVLPTVSAGADQVKRSSFTQVGSASDSGSGINTSTEVWSKVSGPGVVSFTPSNALSTLISASVDGVYTIKLTVSDNAGNSNSSTFQLTWDTTPPAVSSNNVIGGWFTSNPNITLSVSDSLSGPNNVRYNWDSAASASVGTVFTNGTVINILSDGSHTLYIYADDNAGNPTNYSAVYRLDTVNPTVSATNSSLSWRNSVPSIVVNASDTLPGSGVSTIKYGWDAAASILVTNGTDLASTYPSDGTHTLNIVVTDVSGRTGSFTGVYMVDRVNPTDPGTPSTATPTPTTTQVWSWAASTDATSGVANYLWRVVGGPSGSSLTTSVTTNLTQGTWTFFVKAVDNAGNQSNETSFTVVVDTTAPVTVDSGTDSLWHKNPVTVTLNCSDNLSGCKAIFYTTDGSDPVTSPTVVATFGSSVNIVLAVQGVYTIRYYSEDNATNTEVTKTAANTVKIDTTAPTVSATGASPTLWHTSNINITLSAADLGGSGLNNVRYNWDSAATASVGTVFTNGTVINIPSDGTHILYLYADDNAGNSQTFSGTYLLDTVPPTVSAGASISTRVLFSRVGTATDATSGIASVSWSASSANVIFSSPNSLTTNISSSVDGVYTVTLTAFDVAGNSNSSSFTLTWDTTAPVTLDNTDNLWHNTPVTITLTCTDNLTGCAHTYYTTDGSTPTVLSSQGTSIVLNTSNVYTIKYFSVDAVGNTEAVKTAPNQVKIDLIPPVISAVTLTNTTTGNNLYVKNGDSVTLSATVTDNNQALLTIAMISANLSSLGGGGAVHPLSYNNLTGLATWASLVVSGTGNGNVSITINASDIANNPATAQSVSVLADNTLPVTSDNTDTLWHNTPVTITLTCSDLGSGCNKIVYTKDGSNPTISPTAITVLGSSTTILFNIDGIYTLKYYSVDNAGNIELVKTSVNTVKLDQTPPTGSWSNPLNGAAINQSVNLTYTTSDNLSGVATVNLFYKRNDGVDTFHSMSTPWDTTPLPLGNYILRMVITDVAGNVANVDINVDIIAIISNLRSNVASFDTVEIRWDTNYPTTSKVIFGTSSGVYSGSTNEIDTNLVTSHYYRIAGLGAGTKYYYRVISRINGGANSISQELTFMTFSIPGPSSSGSSSSSSGSSASSQSAPATVASTQPAAQVASNQEFSPVETAFASQGENTLGTQNESSNSSLPSSAASIANIPALHNLTVPSLPISKKLIVGIAISLLAGGIIYYLLGIKL